MRNIVTRTLAVALSLTSASVATLALAAAGAAHAQTLNDLYPELATLVASDGAAVR